MNSKIKLYQELDKTLSNIKLIEMKIKKLPSQYWSALTFYKNIQSKFPNYKIVFTGHSLGGSLAQILGNETGNETVTFNAYGTGNIININPNNLENIRNYGHVKDRIFNNNIHNQIGKIYLLEHHAGGPSKPLKYHYLEKIGNLKIEERTQAILKLMNMKVIVLLEHF